MINFAIFVSFLKCAICLIVLNLIAKFATISVVFNLWFTFFNQNMDNISIQAHHKFRGEMCICKLDFKGLKNSN